MKALFISCALLLSALSAFAQGYQFTEVVTVPATPVKKSGSHRYLLVFRHHLIYGIGVITHGKGRIRPL